MNLVNIHAPSNNETISNNKYPWPVTQQTFMPLNPMNPIFVKNFTKDLGTLHNIIGDKLLLSFGIKILVFI